MPKRENLAGLVSGRLTAVECVGVDKHRNALWKCKCECGNTPVVRADDLKSGKVKSCGCLNAELVRSRSTTHGHSHSSTYGSWQRMVQRCTNPNNIGYTRYGGAGVTIYPAWRTFRGFLADMGERPLGTSLGRFLDLGNYEPGNCAWMTSAEQGYHKRLHNRVIKAEKKFGAFMATTTTEAAAQVPPVRRSATAEKKSWMSRRPLARKKAAEKAA